MGTEKVTAFREFVLKVHGRCNLSCDYCYVYELADQRWRHRPAAMAPPTADAAVDRIAEHAATHHLDHVRLVLHGGEPLLAGTTALRRVLTRARDRVPTPVRFALQTNAALLTPAFCDLFDEFDVAVGVSLDGTPADHDHHRRTRTGRGSHTATTRGLHLLTTTHPHLFAGLLCVIDPTHDPLDTLTALAAWNPPLVDLLLPHGTWATPPPHRTPDDPATPYGDWLTTAFDHWYTTGTPPVRLFTSLLDLILGGSSTVEGLGTTASPQLVIETDGTLERSDILAAVAPTASATGLTVHHHRLDDALLPPPPLSATCTACPLLPVCGGGHPAHRLHPDTGLITPSVYCPDLTRLITHALHRVTTDLEHLR
ncbi:FxsB family cyclophane-forming radical SAM/SPASM peptide maturase [Actinokineospora bangkokensis]|uniref:Radical SAM core domain-containing protein n=1 Tax=Actinokineospora bangkokensis TaxID=1193682 RepID=A0A1Q9LPA1_9PSEU|nr:FxsB family cyclophane-forming radical SAM/SPASM peptide maturase [Actinokineospora bangkokensis]OLR93829.1 hypothetical protein BJP25_16515 [Actinokineospora bangkokensis]